MSDAKKEKYDFQCGACVRAYLAEAGIGCISLGSVVSVLLTGKDVHDLFCKVSVSDGPEAVT